ncbi:MAG: acyl-CoA reductase [Acidobacteriota bacterium]|nr:acyl-CoA reductase [Acidobacteriota bacterium]
MTAAAEVAATWKRLCVRGATTLNEIGPTRLLEAWNGAIQTFRDPETQQRNHLMPDLARQVGMSEPCLAASLEALLDGFAPPFSAEVFTRVSAQRAAGPFVVVLAATVPGLALQPLLAGLALGRAVLCKQSSRESSFTSAFVAELSRREPALRGAVATVTWKGGDAAVEEPLFDSSDVVAYGSDETVYAIAALADSRLVAFGAKASIAVLGSGPADLDSIVEGLTRDICLFDQRGCLSVQAIYTEGRELAEALHARLGSRDHGLGPAARTWPPGKASAAAMGRVRHERDAATLLGKAVADLPIGAGTVILDPEPRFVPSPGLRAVRIHPLDSLVELAEALSPLRGRLQGAAVAGTSSAELARISELGFSRVCQPGELQSPPAAWTNGGIDLVERLSVPPVVSG